jgi:hypothetical protein
MNEEVTNKLEETLVSLIDNATAAANFVVEEVPDVIHQLLVWKMAESLADCIIPSLVLAAFLAVSKKLFDLVKSRYKLDPNDRDEFMGVHCAISIPWIIISAAWSVINIAVVFIWFNFDWLKIWLAPKVYLIEYAADLVK